MPSQAQRKRAEARGNRRDNDSDAAPENERGSSEDQTLDAVKQAAKVAAASVAAGAVAAAVRALANRHESSEEQDSEDQDSKNREQPDQEPEQSAQAEPEQHAEQEQELEREEEEETEPEPEREQMNEQPRPREQAQTSVRHEPIEGATSDEAREVVDGAKQQLELLLGKTPEMVSSLERTDDGWLVTVEVVEVSRIPESTDVLASYEIELDDARNLRRYARVRRYNRSQAEREGVS